MSKSVELFHHLKGETFKIIKPLSPVDDDVAKWFLLEGGSNFLGDAFSSV